MNTKHNYVQYQRSDSNEKKYLLTGIFWRVCFIFEEFCIKIGNKHNSSNLFEPILSSPFSNKYTKTNKHEITLQAKFKVAIKDTKNK